jgi:hypothetical protein
MRSHRDLHSAHKIDSLNEASIRGADFKLTRLQWAKNDAAFSLHVRPSEYTSSGIQRTDLLAYLGLRRMLCPSHGVDAYCASVDQGFDLAKFASGFGDAYERLVGAEGLLNACGYFLDRPEGWDYFCGRSSGRSPAYDFGSGGDGHTAPHVEELKRVEDETFLFVMSFMKGAGHKGWTFHYRPKHGALSAELSAALDFLKLGRFDGCPRHDFENCRWKFFGFKSDGSGHFDENTSVVHGFFDAHVKSFSAGVAQLLAANAAVEFSGRGFIPMPAAPAARMQKEMASHTTSGKAATSMLTSSTSPPEFEVAISFAGTERQYARKLADLLSAAGVSVFYDDYYPDMLWGKNLVELFDDIYRKRARYCVQFISAEYAARMWTNHERKSAQARALVEKGNEYLLPIRVDETELPGMAPTLGYLPLSRGIDSIANALLRKLGREPADASDVKAGANLKPTAGSPQHAQDVSPMAQARKEVLTTCAATYAKSPTAWAIWHEVDSEAHDAIDRAARELEEEGLIRAQFAGDRTIVHAQITRAGRDAVARQDF